MFASLSTWEIVSLLSKLCWYLGVTGVAGGIASVWILADHSRRGLQWSVLFTLAGALLGFHGVIFYFLAQVGAASNTGLTGMFNWGLISFYLNLGVGETSLLRMGIFLTLVLGQLFTIGYLKRLTRPPGQAFFRFFYRLNGIAVLILLLSFQATGHTAPLGLAARVAIILHVLCVALWLGSLVPLLRSTHQFEPGQVRFIMGQFSRRATVMVSVLLAAAGLLVVNLIASPGELFSSAYGLNLLLKTALVSVMLSLAALNRWWLVPKLESPGGIYQLRRSIALETVVGLLVLAVTVYLSTVIGPLTHSE
jgi:putative copper resistance protein D